MRAPPRLSTKKLWYFTRVAQEKSFRAAADHLHVSQPALGMQIRELEEMLGVELLNRTNRGVALTKSGEIFLAHAIDALEAVLRAERCLQPQPSAAKSVRMGVTPSVGRLLALDLLSSGWQETPGNALALREGLGVELMRLLDVGELDATLCYDPPDSLDCVPLFEEDLVLVGAFEPGQDHAPARVRDLAKLPLALGGRDFSSRRALDGVVAHKKITLNVVFEIGSPALCRELLLHRKVYAVAPYALFISDILAGALSARPIKPAITQVMNIAFAASCGSSTRQRVLNGIRSSLRDCAAQMRLGWRLL